MQEDCSIPLTSSLRRAHRNTSSILYCTVQYSAGRLQYPPNELPQESSQKHIIEEGLRQKGRKKVVPAFWGTELIQFLAAPAIGHQDDLRKRINRITANWQNRCFGKWMIILFTSHQTKPIPYLNGCSPKNFCSNHPFNG